MLVGSICIILGSIVIIAALFYVAEPDYIECSYRGDYDDTGTDVE